MSINHHSAFLFGAALPVPVGSFSQRPRPKNPPRSKSATVKPEETAASSSASEQPSKKSRAPRGHKLKHAATEPSSDASPAPKAESRTLLTSTLISPTASPVLPTPSLFGYPYLTKPTRVKSNTSQSSGNAATSDPPRNANDSTSDPSSPRPSDSSRLLSLPSKTMTGYAGRAESLSSNSGTASMSTRTVSTDATISNDTLITSKPFVLRNGRTYLSDTTLSYPLPTDLTELHRQSMRTLLMIQIFGAPVCSPSFSKRPPKRVLEIGCGSGFWSMMCHRHFKSMGYGDVSFTGIDIAPIAPSSAGNGAEMVKPDAEMKWEFVAHDLRSCPWPLPTEGYDLIMVKDMSLATSNQKSQDFIDEYLRVLRPGGVMEIWESDHLIRMLRPHVADPRQGAEDSDEREAASLGAYVINANTPLAQPLNVFLVEYNQWLSRALEARDLTAVPCTLIGPTLLQESEALVNIKSKRMAIPLSDLRWEREGAGSRQEKRTLTAAQEALRNTALLTVVQQVQALEPILREASGKSQDEWDAWLGKMMGDLMSESGTSWGECLEVGAWYATKRTTQ